MNFEVYKSVYSVSVMRVKTCALCGKESLFVSRTLSVCRDCILSDFKNAYSYILDAHKQARSPLGLPTVPPRSDSKVKCNLCANQCSIPIGQKSYCGLYENHDNMLKSIVNSRKALMYWYLDPHVTNCTAAWFCPAGTGIGYPKFAYKDGPEIGYYNLAVFFYGCNFDCLFCQNSSHKFLSEGRVVTINDFVDIFRDYKNISCICYFGGSPEPQLPFTINASKAVLETYSDRIVRICAEWNGCGNSSLVKKLGELALESGGVLKFDLKTYSENLSIALSGVSNRQAYKNFEMLYNEFYNERPEIPLITASTLLVPGYVTPDEVEQITSFIASLNPEIPYTLLIFHPDYLMTDLPVTPYEDVVESFLVAKKYLKNVYVGNLHLIGFLSFKSFLRSIRNNPNNE